MTELTQLSQDENAILIQLSKKASKDADTIKFLTLLTLVYLPASLVSVCAPIRQGHVTDKSFSL
jgi:hypothetical protein